MSINAQLFGTDRKLKIKFKNRQHKMSIMYRTMFIIGWYAKYLWPL